MKTKDFLTRTERELHNIHIDRLNAIIEAWHRRKVNKRLDA